ncbi:MAG: PilZ domain-containing protein [Sedimentisphaerales bacterium]|nr:PilZ domain-containing protein [Sedimentisphaerales bacterium]
MNEMVTLPEEKMDLVLKTVIEEKVPSIMSYLSRGKWHVAKVLLTELAGNRLSVESVRAKKKQRPINIQVAQPVGISFKHEYGKFVFDTTVTALEPSPHVEDDAGCGGKIVLSAPEKIQVVERRSYFRVEVPQSLKVKVLLWHRVASHEAQTHTGRTEQLHNCCQGRLLDISAGGAQIEVPIQQSSSCPKSSGQEDEPEQNAESESGKTNFRKGQFIGVRFTPMPYETPLTFSAQIRSILPTADGRSISLGLQIVGLEASPEGHKVLTRLIAVVGRYYQMNQSGARQMDKEPITNVG